VQFTVSMPQPAKDTIVWLSLAAGIAAMLLSNYVLDRYHTSKSQASWLARWAGIIATMDVSASVATILISLAKAEKTAKPAAHIRDKLGGTSYVILAVAFLIIIGGLGWSFYRALVAAGEDNSIQHSDEE